MPVALSGQQSRVTEEVSRALKLVAGMSDVNGVSRWYIAELVTIRIFALFESVVEESACRLVCGAKYCDGSSAALLRPVPTRGLERARDAMVAWQRDKYRQLRWSSAKEIGKNLEHLFPASEHFRQVLRNHGLFISRLRKIRNHIAHRSAVSRSKYQEVVRDYYGATIPSLAPGAMLLSPRFAPPLIEQLCGETGIILKEAIRA